MRTKNTQLSNTMAFDVRVVVVVCESRAAGSPNFMYKNTNGFSDIIVAMTLIAISNCVIIIGASIVVCLL